MGEDVQRIVEQMDQTLQQVDAGEIQYRFRLIKRSKELRDDLADLLKRKGFLSAAGKK